MNHALCRLTWSICQCPRLHFIRMMDHSLLMCYSMTCINHLNNLLSILDTSLWMSCTLSINQLCSSCIILYLSFKKERIVFQDASIAVCDIDMCCSRYRRMIRLILSNGWDGLECFLKDHF